MQNVFRSLFSLSLAWTFGVIVPPAHAESPQTPSFCTTGAAPGTPTPGFSNGYGLFFESGRYIASLLPVPPPPAAPPPCLWSTTARLRLDLPQSPGSGSARLNLNSGIDLNSVTGNDRRFTTTTISPVICTSFLDPANLPPGLTRSTIFALDLTNGGGTRMGGLCAVGQPGGNPERCLWGVTGSALQFGVGTAASGISMGLATNTAGLPYLQCYDATIPNGALSGGSGGDGILYSDGFELPAPNVRVEFLADSESDQRIEELIHATGGSAAYRVRVTNLSGLPLTGVHLREFVPGSGGSITPAVATDSCEELVTGIAPAACPTVRLDRQIDLAAGQSRVFRLRRSISGPVPISPAVGGLLAVAAFVNPDQGADANPADNVRSLRLGTTTSFIVTPVVVGNGSISPSTPQQVPPGENRTFRLTPSANNVVQSAAGCPGKLLDGPGNEKFFEVQNLQSSCTLTVTFALVTYTVTAAPTTNGTITITTPTVPQGQPATFTVVPAIGFSANPPTGTPACGTLENTGGVNWRTSPITSNGCQISATFTLNQYQVTVTTSGGNGTISALGGNPGTSPVVQTVGHGATASVEVTPAVGHSAVFGSASLGNCTFSPQVTSNIWVSSPITAPCTINVTFVRNSYTVTAERSPSNPADSVATIVPATQQVLHDDDATITVTVNTGFRLVSGSATGCPGIQVSPDANNIRRFFITVPSVQAACTVAITSERLPPPP